MGRDLLEGIRVIDFSTSLSAPYLTKLMSDMGAEIIKVERPPPGDVTRYWTPLSRWGMSAYFALQNRGKKSVSINLKHPKGMDIVKKLISVSDVLVENFRVGVMARLGLDYPRVKEINPRIIYCSITCFGQTGPYAHLPGYDIISQAMGGFNYMTGEPDGPPLQSTDGIGDMNAGAHALGAICAALYWREKTGAGQYIDVSMVEGLAGLHPTALGYACLGENSIPRLHPKRYGRIMIDDPLYAIYPTHDDRYMAVAVLTREQYDRIKKATKIPELVTDERFKDFDTLCASKESHDAFVPIFEKWTKSLNRDELIKILREADIPCAPILSIEEVVSDPHLKYRGFFKEVKYPITGSQVMPRAPFICSESTIDIRRPPPLLGQNNEEILKLVGYSDKEINELYEKEIIFRDKSLE